MKYFTGLSGQIENYWPDNTPTELYLESRACLSEIIETSRDHFGDRYDPEKIRISVEHIHTYCLTLDYHDPSDYTNFIVVTLSD